MADKVISYIRILKIEIQNFKNISYGKLQFPSCDVVKNGVPKFESDVIGIYGQNGSGKTALVEALLAWRMVMERKNLSDDLRVLCKEDTKFKVVFFIVRDGHYYIVEHELELSNTEPTMKGQTVYCRIWNEDVWGKKKQSDSFYGTLESYARNGLWIVTTRQLGSINLNMGKSIDFGIDRQNGLLVEEKSVLLFEENYMEKEEMPCIRRMTQQMDIVLQAILPGLQIKLNETDEGNQCRFSFYAQRDGMDFPLKYESGGLKRIISILSILIAGYHSTSVCIVIDEVDAGVFEFLLGELLEMMRNGAKGQFLFTSHNLRALEVLGKDHIIFSTTNPDNRYITFANIRKNQNLRDEYLRALLLGGQKETIYDEPKSYEMGYAFRKAGKLYDET